MIDSKKFEILSAYLDGEVSETEKALVEQWIASEPLFRSYYLQQTKLRQVWQAPKVPAITSSSSLDTTWEFIESRQQKRWASWGVMALSVSLLGMVALIIPPRSPWQSAQEETIILALEQPIIPMPKSLLSSSVQGQ